MKKRQKKETRNGKKAKKSDKKLQKKSKNGKKSKKMEKKVKKCAHFT